MGKMKREPNSVELANKIIEQYQPKSGVASGKWGYTTLRKSKHKKPNFSVL